MNLYAVLFVAGAVVVLALTTGMSEPFNLVADQFSFIKKEVGKNDVIFNTAVLVLFIAVLVKAVHMVSGRSRNGADQERPDRPGDRGGPGWPDGRAQ